MVLAKDSVQFNTRNNRCKTVYHYSANNRCKSWGNLLFFLENHVPQDTLKTISAHCAWVSRTHLCRSLQNRALELAKAKEQALDNEQYLRILFDSFTAGMILIDPETHTIVDANQYALNLSDNSKKNMVGNICHKNVCPAEKNNAR